MTLRFPAFVLSALLVAAGYGATDAVAQDAAAVIQDLEAESDQGASAPDWPAGLQDWDSSPRDPEGNPDEAEERGLLSPGVTESGVDGPTEQGTRTTETLEEDSDPRLYDLLAQVRSDPPDVDGNPIPRPNPLASEPTTEMVPAQPEDVYLFPEGYVE